jgi:hypothetical protein
MDGLIGLPPKPRKVWLVEKDNVQTPDDKIMFIQSHYAVHIISTMSKCRNQM